MNTNKHDTEIVWPLTAVEWRNGATEKPERPMPHVAMLVGGKMRFGRYSEVSGSFQAWIMLEYVVVGCPLGPDWYADLGG